MFHKLNGWHRGFLVLGAGVLGDSLGSLGNSVLGKLSRKDKTDSGLDLSGRKSRLVVEAAELSSLSSDTLEDVSDERVHDGHSAAGDTGIRVNLLENLVDVGRVGLNALLAALGFGLLGLLWLLGRGLGGFRLGRHAEVTVLYELCALSSFQQVTVQKNSQSFCEFHLIS